MSKVAVVTGAGAGVGRATARAFAGAGYNVGLIGRNLHRLEAAAADVRSKGQEACVAAADVADAQAIEEAADKIAQSLGPIEIWVNNAMATVFASVAETTAEEFRRGTEVTYLGTVHGVMAALRHYGAATPGHALHEPQIKLRFRSKESNGRRHRRHRRRKTLGTATGAEGTRMRTGVQAGRSV